MLPESLRDRVAAAGRILLTSHSNPDGDAIGSELGLMRALRSQGKRVETWNLDPAPGAYRGLPGATEVHVGGVPPDGFPEHFDLVIVLECPGLDRTGLEPQLADFPLVNIDHHLGNQGYGVENWVDPDAPAVSVMVLELLLALGANIDDETASCLHLALVTDTGGFRFANASPRAFRAAAQLVELGARIETVSRWVYESQPEASVRLLGEMLGTLERRGKVASVHLTLEMFERAGAGPGDSEGLIDVPRSIAGVDAVVLLRELGPEQWKISLRSRGAINVESIARELGGGGHANAAGCRAQGRLGEVRERLVERLLRLVGATDES